MQQIIEKVMKRASLEDMSDTEKLRVALEGTVVETSYILAHLCYRDNIIENRHASNKPADMQFYADAMSEFVKAYSKARKEIVAMKQIGLSNVLASFAIEKARELDPELAKALSQISHGTDKNYYKSFLELSNGENLFLMSYRFYVPGIFASWDYPDYLDIPLPTLSKTKRSKRDFEKIAEFALGGALHTACSDQWELSDPEMKIINKDVYNRIYTMVQKGLIPMPCQDKWMRETILQMENEHESKSLS